MANSSRSVFHQEFYRLHRRYESALALAREEGINPTPYKTPTRLRLEAAQGSPTNSDLAADVGPSRRGGGASSQRLEQVIGAASRRFEAQDARMSAVEASIHQLGERTSSGFAMLAVSGSPVCRSPY